MNHMQMHNSYKYPNQTNCHLMWNQTKGHQEEARRPSHEFGAYSSTCI